MKRTVMTTALIATALIATTATAEEWQGNVSLVLGNKSLDSNDWHKQDDHGSIGLISNFRQDNWPVSMAVDVFGTGQERTTDGMKRETYSSEAHLGVRKVFDLKEYIEDCRLHPYVGAGVAFVFAEDNSTVAGVKTKDDDTATGGWVGVGSYVEVTEHFQLGADLRYSQADVTLNGEDRDAGGMLAGLSGGYRW